MADQKSKLPDMNEIASMAKKLFRDVHTSISQIIDDYKSKHAEPEVTPGKPVDPTQAATRPVEPRPVNPIEPQPVNPAEPRPVHPIEPEPVKPTEPNLSKHVEPTLEDTEMPQVPVDANIRPKVSKAKVTKVKE